MMMPLGTYTKAMRTGGFELRVAASAGAIASRNGSATAVPRPRRNVRLGRNFLVIIVELAPHCRTSAARRRPRGAGNLPNATYSCQNRNSAKIVGRTSRSVRMGLRPTNSDENHVGRASTPAAGLQTCLFPNRLRWVFDCARVLQDPLLAQRNRRACTPAAGLEARPTINAGVRLREN